MSTCWRNMRLHRVKYEHGVTIWSIGHTRTRFGDGDYDTLACGKSLRHMLWMALKETVRRLTKER